MTEQVLGNLKRGLLFVMSAPAGSGKSTLANLLKEEFSGVVTQSCSATTRSPRPEEIDGKDYTFLSKEAFDQKVRENAFLEHALVFGHQYGTFKEEVECLQAAKKHVLLVIDTQGALYLKEKNLEAVFIFISAPSIDELKRRLVHRHTEGQATINERLSWASDELKKINAYDYHIINDDLKTTYAILRSILIAEEHKVRRS